MARYYDASAGQFASADSLGAGGLNRFGYVGGNPETATDPSGHMKNGCIEDQGNWYCPPNPPPPSPPPSGSGGNTTQTTTLSAVQTGPTHDQVLKAQADANKAAAELNFASFVLLGIATLLTAAAAAAAASIFDFWITVGIITSGLVGAFGAAGIEAGAVGQVIALEVADHPDDSWWTVSNVESWGDQVKIGIGAMSIAVFSLGEGILRIPAVQSAFAAVAGLGIMAGAALSQLWLPTVITDLVNQEVADLGGATTM